MPRPPVSVTIITLNEEANIAQAIRSASWADEVLVVDSGSSDKTVEIAKSLGARVLANSWKGYGQQKNFAQKSAQHDWVLNIDADERIPDQLAQEIQTALGNGGSNARGFYMPRKTFYIGHWIRHGGWYPNHLVRLANRNHARWSEPQVHEQLTVSGEIRELKAALHHHAFPKIRDQIITNLRFSQLGSEDLMRLGQKPSVLKLLWKPLGKFLETYFVKRGFLDGLPGLIISINAAHSMFLKYAFLIEDKVRNPENANPDHR